MENRLRLGFESVMRLVVVFGTVVVFTFVLTYSAEDRQVVSFIRNTTQPIVGVAVPPPAPPRHGLGYFAGQYAHLLTDGYVMWIAGAVAFLALAYAAKRLGASRRTPLDTDPRAGVALLTGVI